MALPSNREFFDAFTLALFSRLYESFPSPTDIDARTIAYDLLPEDVGESGRHHAKVAEDAMQWLARENFITIDYESQDLGGEFVGVVLTSRGLALLNSIPDASNSEETVAAQIGELVEEASKDLAKEEVRRGIKSLMLYVVKAAAGWAIS